MTDPADRRAVFDGIRIGRPATGALIDTGYRTRAADLEELLALHCPAPEAVELLRRAEAG